MKNFELFTLERALKDITNEKLRATTAYRLLSILKHVARETEIIRAAISGYIEFETKIQSSAADHEGLVAEYKEDIDQANELLGQEFSGEFKKIKVDDLKLSNGEEVCLSMKQLSMLDTIIEEA